MRRVSLVVVAALLTGCGSSAVQAGGSPVASPYTGAMHVPLDYDDGAPVAARSGAAGRAVECSGDPYDGGGGDYAGGLESVQGTAAKALDNFLDEEGLISQLPGDGYRVEREDDGRTLLSYDVDERTQVAFIAVDSVRDVDGKKGWGIESWAECDPAELPADVTDALGIGVWRDESGQRVPVTRIHSFQGAKHCDWEDITFLLLGHDREAEPYLRDTSRELGDLLRTTYSASAALPAGSTDTGFRRNGRHLWVGPGGDAAYLVSLKNPHDVERWPAAKQRVACA